VPASRFLYDEIAHPVPGNQTRRRGACGRSSDRRAQSSCRWQIARLPADMGGNMVRARLPGMASERAIWAGETIGRRSSLPGNWPEEGMLPVVLVTGSGRPAARRAAMPAQCPRARNALRRLAAIKARGSAVDLDPGGSCTVVTAGRRASSWPRPAALWRAFISHSARMTPTSSATCRTM
jgi:hypothetical protein